MAIPDENRRGLLGQSSFLLVTSVANRTSPVARGKWVLENFWVLPLLCLRPMSRHCKRTKERSNPHPLRQRMEEHRTNPVCAACHKIMDPIGFSLENFDLIGTWRSAERGVKIDASGQLVDGTKLDGPASLRQALAQPLRCVRPDRDRKALTYGTGRALKYYDMPVVRSIDPGRRKE